MSSCYFGYYCHEYWRNFYVSMGLFLSGLPIILSSFRFYHMPNFQKLRITLFVLQASFGIVPLLHWINLEGFDSETGMIFFRIVFLYLILALAFFFYFSSIPERFSPGTFDFFFSSHQIWHLLTFLAAFYHQMTLEIFLQSKSFHKC